MITLREFRPEDASGIGDLEPGDALIGISAEIDGALAGYAGIRDVLGRGWVFFSILDERLRRPALIHRTTLQVLRSAAEAGINPVYAFCDDKQSRAEVWLKRLGFRLMRDGEKDPAIMATEEVTKQMAWIRKAAQCRD